MSKISISKALGSIPGVSGFTFILSPASVLTQQTLSGKTCICSQWSHQRKQLVALILENHVFLLTSEFSPEFSIALCSVMDIVGLQRGISDPASSLEDQYFQMAPERKIYQDVLSERCRNHSWS